MEWEVVIERIDEEVTIERTHKAGAIWQTRKEQ
jgi:hypothetical protein